MVGSFIAMLTLQMLGVSGQGHVLFGLPLLGTLSLSLIHI